MTNSILTR